jgi:hypothetical protein
MSYSYWSSDLNQTIYICLVTNPFLYGVTLDTSRLVISHLLTRAQKQVFKPQIHLTHLYSLYPTFVVYLRTISRPTSTLFRRTKAEAEFL